MFCKRLRSPFWKINFPILCSPLRKFFWLRLCCWPCSRLVKVKCRTVIMRTDTRHLCSLIMPYSYRRAKWHYLLICRHWHSIIVIKNMNKYPSNTFTFKMIGDRFSVSIRWWRCLEEFVLKSAIENIVGIVGAATYLGGDHGVIFSLPLSPIASG